MATIANLLLLMFLALFVFPFSLLLGAFVAFVLFRKRNKWFKIGLTTLIALMIPAGILCYINVSDYMLSQNYWKYTGRYDYYRMPLEYPWELAMINDINDAFIRRWQQDPSIDEPVENIQRYAKDGAILVGQCKQRSDAGEWFIFNCKTGSAAKFPEKRQWLAAAKAHGFETEPNLLSVRRNWHNFWSNPQNWKNKKTPRQP